MKGTIKSKEEISRFFKDGSKFSSKGFLALYAVIDDSTSPLDPRSHHHTHITTTHPSHKKGRLAFAAGKKLGTAPERNRAKRRLREAARKAGAPWGGYDVVLVARAGALTMEFSVLTQELARLKTEITEHFKKDDGQEPLEEQGHSASPSLEEQEHRASSRTKEGLKSKKLAGKEVLDFVIGIPRNIALLCIFIYRHAISPLLPPSCGYVPTCSEYAVIAFTRFGFWKGLWLSVKRIGRCHPFAKGGYDPVPEKSSEKIA